MTAEQDVLLVGLLRELLRGVVQEELKPLQKQVKEIDKGVGRIEKSVESVEEGLKANRVSIDNLANRIDC